MRKLVWGNTQSPAGDCIAGVERTQGTETSKYLEEKKETSIPSVAASESGDSPNRDSSRGCGRLELKIGQSNGLERPATAGDSPVGGDRRQASRGVPE